ncbi:helix-turn-helix transcriptional regulator [Psychroserpens sp. NJDZ02]|uniref:helix-turn-helix transcriptional regulator n=1 Tax=Psychroserpens sp. NJDZ02 TaxID=2570561 RepID=UPI0010A8122C|nr:WYL domain-containing protein [Psychroserpens sp. NJDZ02]QCE42387.1 WYL domain-containing protein [Psychroserpens sp. NJDZ02]
MATNRHAQIRYTILDKCFSNFNRNFTYDDLLEEINQVLQEIGSEGIQLRQLQYDIAHMKSDVGYAIELNEDLKEGKKRVFRYNDKNFSLANNPLNVEDTEQLESTLAILSRYKNREEFNWLEELIPRMEQAFDLVSNGDDSAISYQGNQDLKGLHHLGVLFNLIIKRKVTEIEYETFANKIELAIVYPYHLKQYNNRWFLFCFNPTYNSISNYPLDRITQLRETVKTFAGSSINWLDYFEDIIGVTKPMDVVLEKIKLKFSENRINYVLTKPLHGTQKIDKEDKSNCLVLIEVIPNRELYQQLLAFGEDVEVISPKRIRQEMINKIKLMSNQYNHAE